LKSLVFELNEKQAENLLSERLEQITGSSKERIILELKNTSGKMPQNLELDIDLFKKIKEIQELPDWVIVKLLMADKSLSRSNFKERIIGY
jgi:hypothetical protein